MATPSPVRGGSVFAAAVGVSLSVLMLSACSDDAHAPAPVATEAASVPAPTPTRASLPPLPDTGTPTSAPPSEPISQAQPAPASGSCGSVTAASGMPLHVLGDPQTNVDCPQATSVVTEFHAKIARQQPAGSDQPVNAVVDGWSCVSGPPSAQGGTICSLDEKTILAAVAPAE